MNKSYKALLLSMFALTFLGACASTDDTPVFGPASPQGGTASGYEIRGTVDSVDTSRRSINLIEVTGNRSGLSNAGTGDRMTIYYDERTPLSYNGRSYTPANLERGDQVSAVLDSSGLARSMTLLYNVSGTTSVPGGYASNVRGVISYVDASRRTIEIDRTGGSRMTVEFTTDTPVYYQQRSYRVTDLERGDEVDVQVSETAGRLYAQRIDVVRSVSDPAGGTSSAALSTLRGTVRYVDTSRRTIELDSTTWIQRFDTRGGSTTGRVLLQYESNVPVLYGGRTYEVTNLEVGDVIDADVRTLSGGALLAQRITVVRDVNQR